MNGESAAFFTIDCTSGKDGDWGSIPLASATALLLLLFVLPVLVSRLSAIVWEDIDCRR